MVVVVMSVTLLTLLCTQTCNLKLYYTTKYIYTTINFINVRKHGVKQREKPSLGENPDSKPGPQYSGTVTKGKILGHSGQK